MKTPDPSRPRHHPPRAEPLQADRPGRGDRQEPADGAAKGTKEQEGRRSSAHAKDLKKQVDDAVENAREGYD